MRLIHRSCSVGSSDATTELGSIHKYGLLTKREVKMVGYGPSSILRWLWNEKQTVSLIGHFRYINILTWNRGFRVKLANFESFFCLSIPNRDLDTKKKNEI